MRKNVFGILVAVFLIATLALSAVTPSVFAQGGPTPTPTVMGPVFEGEERLVFEGPWTLETGLTLWQVEERSTYEAEEGCPYTPSLGSATLYEQECFRLIGQIWAKSPFVSSYTDGYRRCEGQVRPGYEHEQFAGKISIPPGYETTDSCWLEVLVLRPVGMPSGMLEQRGNITQPWTVEDAVRFYDLQGTELQNMQQNGLQSWVAPSIDGVEYRVANSCDNWLDGVRAVPGETRPGFANSPDGAISGIPPHSYGVSALTVNLRECLQADVVALAPIGEVAVYQTPSIDSVNLGSLAAIPNVKAIGYVTINGENWWRLADGSGWVQGSSVDAQATTLDEPIAEANFPTPTQQFAQPTGQCTVSTPFVDVNVRRGTSTSSTSLGYLDPNIVYIVDLAKSVPVDDFVWWYLPGFEGYVRDDVVNEDGEACASLDYDRTVKVLVQATPAPTVIPQASLPEPTALPPVQEQVQTVPEQQPESEQSAEEPDTPSIKWSKNYVRERFGISTDATATSCGANCWQFENVTLTNNSRCWQSGYTSTEHELWEELGQTDPKTGIPPNWSGMAEVAKLAPCGQ